MLWKLLVVFIFFSVFIFFTYNVVILEVRSWLLSIQCIILNLWVDSTWLCITLITLQLVCILNKSLVKSQSICCESRCRCRCEWRRWLSTLPHQLIVLTISEANTLVFIIFTFFLLALYYTTLLLLLSLLSVMVLTLNTIFSH